MEIRSISQQEIWQKFLEKEKPNSFLHSWNYGEFNSALESKIFRIGIFDNDELIGIALFIKTVAKRGTFLLCPHGPIIKSGSHYFEVLKILMNYVKDLGVKENCDFIRVCPLVLKSQENEKMFLDLGFSNAPIHMHPELTWLLNLNKSEEDLLKDMRKTTRYCIRKSQKDGITIEQSDDPKDLEKFWIVYEETFSRQKFTPFSKNYLKQECEIFMHDNELKLFFGKYNDEIISAAIIVFSKHSAFYHHGGSMQKYAKINAAYLVLWEAICEAKKRGCEIFNFYGVVPENAIDHPWHGLSLFKRGFGGFEDEYVHAKDLPLTWKYWLNFVVEKLRKWKRGV